MKTKRTSLKLWFGIIGVFVFIMAGLLVGWRGMFGRLAGQSGNLYEDPQGRFTMEIDPSWEQVETDGPYTQFMSASPPMNMYLLVLKAKTVNDAFSLALEIVGFDPGLLNGGNVASAGAWQLYSQVDTAGLNNGLAGQIVGEIAYVMMVKAGKPGITIQTGPVMGALNSLTITAKEEIKIKNYADLESMVRHQVDSRAGSVSVAAVHGDKIIYTYAYGQANPVKGVVADTQTIYQFASMTKPFTASALMQLVEQGKVDLDAWPGKYIPEFPQRWNVTVRQLLDHSACMPDDDRLTLGLIAKRGESFAPLKETFTAYVKDSPDLACEPGKTSLYANTHFLALARIIEEASGEPFETYMVDHILTPLAMESSGYQLTEADVRYAKGQFPAAKTEELVAKLNEYRGPGQEDLILQKGESFSTVDDYRILPPWGGLRGTPSDITHFLQMYLDHGRYGDIQILKPETVAAMQKMQTSTDGSPLGLGLSWWIGEDEFGKFYYHDGNAEGFETAMRYYPDLDLGVVVMGNVEGYQSEGIVEGLVSAWKHAK